jgi:hypothetical protein
VTTAGVTNDNKILALELKVAELQDQQARLKGLVASLRADREKLRLRVLDAARGNVCSRCEQDIADAEPEAPAAPPPPEVPAVASLCTSLRSPSAILCTLKDGTRDALRAEVPSAMAEARRRAHRRRSRQCDGLGQLPCAAHGGPVEAQL